MPINTQLRGSSSPVELTTHASRVVVRVIRTDEEHMIVRSEYRAIGLGMAS